MIPRECYPSLFYDDSILEVTCNTQDLIGIKLILEPGKEKVLDGFYLFENGYFKAGPILNSPKDVVVIQSDNH